MSENYCPECGTPRLAGICPACQQRERDYYEEMNRANEEAMQNEQHNLCSLCGEYAGSGNLCDRCVPEVM